jgi:hypothetical protein
MQLTKFDIAKINNTISSEEGKIYMSVGGYRSRLWDRLIRDGWRHKTKKGFVVIVDNEGNLVMKTYGWINTLRKLPEIISG